MSASWKVSLPCTRIEAEAIDAGPDILPGAPALDPMPTLVTTEEVLDDAERWRLDAYFDGEPDAAAIAVIAALAPGTTTPPTVERLPDEDWVTMSQSGLAPLHVGRFFVHTGDATVPADARGLRIAAGRAFGTGHHETTSGCLAALDGMAQAGRRFDRIIDIGTGTGLLAFAAAPLWPDAAIVATDIDAVAIDVTRENAVANGVDGLHLIVADGTLDDAVTAAAPYDLVIANILAGPLVSMAPELAAIAAPTATILLAGLLETQRDAVEAAYTACGCTPLTTDRRNDWSVLTLRAGAERFVPAGPFDPKGRDGWALDI
jgi:ribosomal protein L11 methyltransferase